MSKPLTALERYSVPLHLLLVACIALAQYLREPSLFGASQLFKEDSGVLFAHYYNRADSFFVYYMGYVSVGPNILGWLATRTPTRLIGQAFVLLSVLSAAFALSVVYLPRFRPLIPSDRARWLSCLWLSVLPIGNGAILRAVTWSFWPMLLAAGLLLAQPATQHSRGRWFELAYLVIAICSCPLSLVLLPVCLYNAWRARDVFPRMASLGLALLVVVYAIVMHHELGASYWVDWSFAWSTNKMDLSYAAKHLVPVIGDRVVFEPLATSFVRSQLVWRGLLAFTVVGGLTVLVALVIMVRRLPTLAELAAQNVRLLAVLGYVSIAITAVSLATRFGEGAQDYADAFHQRYFWVQQYYLWLAIVGFALALAPRLTGSAKQLAVAAVVLYPVIGGYLDREKLLVGLGDHEAVEAFLRSVEECEEQHCTEPVEFHGHDERFDIRIDRFR